MKKVKTVRTVPSVMPDVPEPSLRFPFCNDYQCKSVEEIGKCEHDADFMAWHPYDYRMASSRFNRNKLGVKDESWLKVLLEESGRS